MCLRAQGLQTSGVLNDISRTHLSTPELQPGRCCCLTSCCA